MPTPNLDQLTPSEQETFDRAYSALCCALGTHDPPLYLGDGDAITDRTQDAIARGILDTRRLNPV